MDSVIVGVIGTLLGVLIGGFLQQAQASRTRRWQQADALSTAKRRVYTEFLRAISASYAQALSGQRTRSEDANLLAATAEIEILSGGEVAEPARDLADTVMRVHARIADGAGVAESAVEDVDRQRHRVIDLFKADLGIKARP
ncbi:hypothetical protein AB0395_41635 [Streptosporangium sp. NPDC051023]|uniref:hypothetical protein n=1 Tax=Streptosporangium sp. NPDC051023 TaxID=3155410 RepID=UPI00344F4E69